MQHRVANSGGGGVAGIFGGASPPDPPRRRVPPPPASDNIFGAGKEVPAPAARGRRAHAPAAGAGIFAALGQHEQQQQQQPPPPPHPHPPVGARAETARRRNPDGATAQQIAHESDIARDVAYAAVIQAPPPGPDSIDELRAQQGCPPAQAPQGAPTAEVQIGGGPPPGPDIIDVSYGIPQQPQQQQQQGGALHPTPPRAPHPPPFSADGFVADAGAERYVSPLVHRDSSEANVEGSPFWRLGLGGPDGQGRKHAPVDDERYRKELADQIACAQQQRAVQRAEARRDAPHHGGVSDIISTIGCGREGAATHRRFHYGIDNSKEAYQRGLAEQLAANRMQRHTDTAQRRPTVDPVTLYTQPDPVESGVSGIRGGGVIVAKPPPPAGGLRTHIDNSTARYRQDIDEYNTQHAAHRPRDRDIPEPPNKTGPRGGSTPRTHDASSSASTAKITGDVGGTDKPRAATAAAGLADRWAPAATAWLRGEGAAAFQALFADHVRVAIHSCDGIAADAVVGAGRKHTLATLRDHAAARLAGRSYARTEARPLGTDAHGRVALATRRLDGNGEALREATVVCTMNAQGRITAADVHVCVCHLGTAAHDVLDL